MERSKYRCCMAPGYHRLGEVPAKRHVAFRAPDGQLYAEEVMGMEGFSGRYSILYHRYAPTRVTKVAEVDPVAAPGSACGLWGRPGPPAADSALRHHLLRTAAAECVVEDELAARTVLLHNDEVRLSLSVFGSGPGRFVRNGGADECHFVHEGGGRLESIFGALDYHPGDYVVIPRGTTYRWLPTADSRHLVIEAGGGGVRLPRRYQSGDGQLLEHAP